MKKISLQETEERIKNDLYWLKLPFLKTKMDHLAFPTDSLHKDLTRKVKYCYPNLVKHPQ